MTRLVNEEQTISSNSDNSCASSRGSSQCFELDTSRPPVSRDQQQTDQLQQQQKRIHLSLEADTGESDQEPANKRIARGDSAEHQRSSCDETKLKHLQHHDDSNKPKRNPFCSRCRNHGKIAQVKGHKRHCDYRDCQCEGCKLVECRQIVSARQIKLRRNQKQDEEYGRRIEVSPPVLKRDTNNDSMSLFAKTLIEATSPPAGVPHFKPQHATSLNTTITESETDSTTALATSAAAAALANKQAKPSDSAGKLLASGYPTAATLQPAPTTDTGATSCSGGGISSTTAGHQLRPPQPQATSTQWSNQRPLITPATLAASSDPNCGDPTLNPALAIPFHLFNLPAPILSQAQAAAASSTASLRKSTTSLVLPSATSTTTWTGTTNAHMDPTVAAAAAAAAATLFQPSIHEQINLVEEIHHTYGPLAIYAWLKYERFDLQKIRDLIELSRSFYDNLLNLKLISHQLGAAGEQHHHLGTTTSTTTPSTTTTTTTSTATTATTSSGTTSSVERSLLNEVSALKHNNCLFKSGASSSGSNISLPPATTSNDSSLTSVMNLYHQPRPTLGKTSTGNCLDSFQAGANTSFQSSTFSKLPTSPSSSLINSYHSMNRNARTTLAESGISYTNDTGVVPQPANHHNNNNSQQMSLAAAVSLNPLPPHHGASDFLWATRDLKMASAAESLSAMRPEHLFSRFMHYQHFSETANHKAHLNQHHQFNLQHHHHHHRPLSPPQPFVTNLSMQSSSTAANVSSSSTTTLL